MDKWSDQKEWATISSRFPALPTTHNSRSRFFTFQKENSEKPHLSGRARKSARRREPLSQGAPGRAQTSQTVTQSTAPQLLRGAQAVGQPLKPKRSLPLQSKKEPPRFYLCVRRSLFPLLKWGKVKFESTVQKLGSDISISFSLQFTAGSRP